MAKDYGGFILIIDQPKHAAEARPKIRREIIEQKYNSIEYGITETISASDWKPKEIEICLVSLDGQSIEFASLALRLRKASTFKRLIRLHHFVQFRPIEFSAFESILQANLRAHFTRTATGSGGRVPPKTWSNIWEIIKEQRPEISAQIEILEQRRTRSKQILLMKPELREQLAQEQDSVQLAAEFFGVNRRKIIPTWNLAEKSNGNHHPFINGLDSVRLREDAMIEHDARLFPGWMRGEEYQSNFVLFSKTNNFGQPEKLTVMSVNRSDVELRLGVDLLYYHHKFESFILVQYKRMHRMDDHDWVYYPDSDSSYRKEHERMKSFEEQMKESDLNDEKSPINQLKFRLSHQPFYFKLCQSINFDPDSSEMIKGKYIPLGHWDNLLNDDCTRGARGALSIKDSKLDRYINNTMFIDLVQGGWIGSRLVASEDIMNIVRTSLDAGRSMTVAYSQQGKHPQSAHIPQPNEQNEPFEAFLESDEPN